MKMSEVPVNAIFQNKNGMMFLKTSNHLVTKTRYDESNCICLTKGKHYGHRITVSSKSEVYLVEEETFKT